jgi:predicted Rossmann fold nucleotide-binding protein DprA/Smf involved in DNA uptake
MSFPSNDLLAPGESFALVWSMRAPIDLTSSLGEPVAWNSFAYRPSFRLPGGQTTVLPATEPLKHHFLERNRIIAALAVGVIVVQAGERSGSLVTARFAAEFGRDVFVMESTEGDPAFSGGDQLIDDGAICIAGAREVLEEYGIKSVQEGDSTLGSWQTLSIEEYREKTCYSASEMLKLELQGLVVRLPGNRISVLVSK